MPNHELTKDHGNKLAKSQQQAQNIPHCSKCIQGILQNRPKHVCKPVQTIASLSTYLHSNFRYQARKPIKII